MPKEQAPKSKRQVIREERVRRQQQQRLFFILGVVVIAVVVAAILIAPSLRNATAPVGDIIQITPEARPSVDGKAMGDASAPVLVEVWEDFQCPACQSYSQQIEPLVMQNYVATGKVRYVFHHFPFLDDNAATRESDQAANASMCALEQGKFWEYHDTLFANWDGENAGAFRDNRLVAFAESLTLDMAAFNTCFDDNKYKNEIDQDMAAGQAAGVSGTPSVFVAGRLLTPGYIPSYDDIAAAVEAALANQ